MERCSWEDCVAADSSALPKTIGMGRARGTRIPIRKCPCHAEVGIGSETFLSFNGSGKQVPQILKVVVDLLFLGKLKLQMFDGSRDLLHINHCWNCAAIF